MSKFSLLWLVVTIAWVSPLFAEEIDDSSEEIEIENENSDTSTAPETQLQLTVGQTYPLEGLIAKEVKKSNESVVEVKLRPEGILLIAKQPGNCILEFSTGSTKMKIAVHVQGAKAKAPSSDVHANLKRIPGIRFEKMGNKIVLQGEVLGRVNYQKLLMILKTYPQYFLPLCTSAPGIKASLMEQAKSLLESKGIRDVQIINAGNRFFLEGRAQSSEEVEQIIESVQTIIPNIENHIPIPLRVDPTIVIRVFMLELSRQAHQALGLQWPSSINNAFVFAPGNGGLGFHGIWSSTIQHLSSKGQAKVLAEPMISVKNGSSANLSAGGQIPLKITGRFENKVEWKHYGLKIKLHIQMIANNRIRTKIYTESSQIDEGTMIDGIPGIRNTNMSTEVDIPEGKPLLLTGLFQSQTAKDVEKMPILGSLPIIGELFKSRRFREHESELLIALLPKFEEPYSNLPLQSARGIEFDKKWRITD